MAIARISDLGAIGVSADKPAYAIEDNAWSFLKNARAYHGKMTNFPGHVVYATPPIEPYGLFGFEAANVGALLWLQAGLSQVYVYDGNTHTDVTRTASNYNTNEYFDRWTGGVQQGIGFLTNGSDTPQQWDKVDPGTKLRDMLWDPAASPGSQTWGELGYTTFAMRAFGGCIFALGIQRGSDVQPGTVAWSTFVQPNDPNLEWQAKTTNSAGEIGLGDTLGACIDAAPLRDNLIIYKEDSAWRCVFTGDADNPFVFERLPNYVRLLNRGCIGVAREFQIVAAPEDCYVFDGNIFRSLLEHRDREYYRSTLWGERKLNAFVSILDQEQEAWICFTSPGSAGETKSPDRAIVWNFHDNTFSRTELPQVRAMSQGPITQTALPGDAFDDPPDISFDEDTVAFDQGAISPADSWLVGAHGSNLSVFGLDNTDNGTPRECVAERTGLVLQDQRSGVRTSDAVMRLKELRPYIEATQPVYIQAGAAISPSGPYEWEPEQLFDPLAEHHVNFRSTGRYFGFRIRSEADMRWELTDMGISYHPQRRR